MWDDDFEPSKQSRHTAIVIEEDLYDVKMAKIVSLSEMNFKRAKGPKLSNFNTCEVLIPEEAICAIAARASQSILDWPHMEKCTIEHPSAFSTTRIKSIWRLSRT